MSECSSLSQHAPPAGKHLHVPRDRVHSCQCLPTRLLKSDRRIISAIRFFWTVRFNEPVQIIDSRFLRHDVFTSSLQLMECFKEKLLLFQMLNIIGTILCTYSVILRREIQKCTNKNIQYSRPLSFYRKMYFFGFTK